MLEKYISDSKQKCLERGLDPHEVPLLIACEAEVFERKRLEYQSVLAVIGFFVTKFLNILKGIPVLVVTTDEQGMILDLGGDETIINTMMRLGIQQGFQITEAINGTNSVSLALEYQRPLSVIGTDHFHQLQQHLACYSVPFHYKDPQNILGTLSIMTSLEYANELFITLLITVVDSIERELALRSQITIDLEDMANNLFANVQDGIIILKGENSVLQINEAARKMFALKEENSSTIRISALISNYNYEENYTNFEVKLLTGRNQQPKVVSLSQSDIKFANHEMGKILIIRDITMYNRIISELRKHRNRLEELVKERTAKLTEMNQQLLLEIAERERKEVQLRKQEELLQSAVASLRESEERYRTLAENAFDLICEVSQEGLFLYASPNFREVMGHQPEELIGQRIFQLVHPDDLPYFSAAFHRAFKNGNSVQNTHRYRHKNGDWIWFEVAGKPYSAPNGDIRVIFNLRDITNRKKMEEEIIKANKLESIGVLAGGFAHDFNNILSIIWGNITMAKKYAGSELKVNQRLGNAERALNRARDLTQQLMVFAKGVEPIKKIVSISSLVSESIYFTLRDSDIHCDFEAAGDLWLVEVDDGQINQVLNNLIINAQQAMPNGGKITIRAENVVITEEKGMPLLDGKYVKVSITDEGLGIPEENLRKIFDPYFSTKPKGTGLGLTSAYTIIKKHNGCIMVESQIGTGTTFHVYLPASESVPLPDKIVKSDVFRGKGRILVMDDERELCEVLTAMLSQIGYEVLTAGDGAEAVELFNQAIQRNTPFSFVIMDLVIPGGMGGKEAIKLLREIDPTVKVIVSSGYSEDPVLSNYTEYGFCEVLKKPYTFDEFMETFNNVVNQ